MAPTGVGEITVPTGAGLGINLTNSLTFTGGGTGTGPEYYYTLGNYTSPLSEKPYTSGAVFNFFPPNYVIPGTTTNAPEFDIENTASAMPTAT